MCDFQQLSANQTTFKSEGTFLIGWPLSNRMLYKNFELKVTTDKNQTTRIKMSGWGRNRIQASTHLRTTHLWTDHLLRDRFLDVKVTTHLGADQNLGNVSKSEILVWPIAFGRYKLQRLMVHAIMIFRVMFTKF